MSMEQAYEAYFGSRVYETRYPYPNRFTLQRLMKLPKGSTILDIGAGNGRYALPLAEAGYSVIAVERSESARDQLMERLSLHCVENNRILVLPELSDVPKGS